jgi:hypothetical protein
MEIAASIGAILLDMGVDFMSTLGAQLMRAEAPIWRRMQDAEDWGGSRSGCPTLDRRPRYQMTPQLYHSTCR